jgi:hypothetical protein
LRRARPKSDNEHVRPQKLFLGLTISMELL